MIPDRSDPVKQDQVWKELVWRERRGVQEWEKNWDFLRNYDQMGQVKPEEPPPSNMSFFSEHIPNTSNQMFGSRLTTPLGSEVVRLDRLVLWSENHRRCKQDPEMLPWFIVFVTYQMYYDYPPPTYLEYPILIAQDVILLLLILHYSGSLRQSLIYALVFVGGWRLLTVEKWIIDLAMSLCTFISAASKFAQLQCLWKSKDAGQVSALSWGMATYTCMARIYTTTVTTGDMQVLVRFIVMTSLNMWVLLTVLYYQRKSSGSKKED